MQHIRIGTYDIVADTFDEIAAQAFAPGGMLDPFRAAPGFVSYSLADLGDGTFLSISLWASRLAAEAAVPTAQLWIAENMAGTITLRNNQVADIGYAAAA